MHDAVKLQEFAKWVLEQSFEGGDIDGGDAQAKALELGLLRCRTRDEIVACVQACRDETGACGCLEFDADVDTCYTYSEEFLCLTPT